MRGEMFRAGDVEAEMLRSPMTSLYKAVLYVNTTTYGMETCVAIGTMAAHLNMWEGRKQRQSAGHACVAVRTIGLYMHSFHIKHASLPNCSVTAGEAPIASSFQPYARFAVDVHICFLHTSRAIRLHDCKM